LFERPNSGQRAVLVHVNFRKVADQPDLQEFHALCLAASFEPVTELVTLRDTPDPKYFIGKGKLDELKSTVLAIEADLILFNHDLSPSQERNIERSVKKRVLSRTGLILEIFAKRARTFEGKLQVELAQLEHQSTRLVRGWTHLERQKGGIGLRGGPGETQLEVDRRLLRKRIKEIEKRLEKIRNQRRQSRHQRIRAGILNVSLVGYTNAGKSTLFNTLTGAKVWVANQLFATLDPTLRAVEVPELGKVILTDTVGFIRELPHSLVDAFRATLEEIGQASLLLHVVDATDPRLNDNIHQVNQVLTEIGAHDIEQLLVFNKADLLDNAQEYLEKYETNSAGLITKVWVSAKDNAGLDLLLEALRGRLSIKHIEKQFTLPFDQGKLHAQLYGLGIVVNEKELPEGGWEMMVSTTQETWQKLCREWEFLTQIESAKK
jgi:GTP-binding protein HflX